MRTRRFVLGALLTTVAGPALAQGGFRFFLPPAGRGHGRYRGRRVVPWKGSEKPGTIVIVTRERALYHILPGGRAVRYGVGVGRAGFQWSGVAHVGRKAMWPEWRPPREMIQRELVQYGRRLPDVMKGGIDNPLGARALYLYRDGRDTMYRIHGTNAPQTIGRAVSSGCIRMLNEEIIELFDRVEVGTKVIVR